jgi:hypothetical protein
MGLEWGWGAGMGLEWGLNGAWGWGAGMGLGGYTPMTQRVGG